MKTTPPGLARIIGKFRAVAGGLPDPRKGKSTSFSMADIALSAFSVFFTQSASPSSTGILAHARGVTAPRLCGGVGASRARPLDARMIGSPITGTIRSGWLTLGSGPRGGGAALGPVPAWAAGLVNRALPYGVASVLRPGAGPARPRALAGSEALYHPTRGNVLAEGALWRPVPRRAPLGRHRVRHGYTVPLLGDVMPRRSRAPKGERSEAGRNRNPTGALWRRVEFAGRGRAGW